MPKKPIKILAVNPGTKYLGIAVFQDGDLRDWSIKTIPGKWSKGKLIVIQSIITDLIATHHPDTLVLKSLDPSRRSRSLETLVSEIRKIAERKGISLQEYSIEDLKRFHSPEERINKRQLAELVSAEYPVLFHELNREIRHKNKYFDRMFEAVALGVMCFHEMGSDFL
jgi:hypothetical protein